MTAPLLSVRRLTRTFRTRDGLRTRTTTALQDVSFDIAAGEVVALLGESGAGKTTAARIIARLLPATSGQLWFGGADVLASEPRRPSPAYRTAVQMIFQDPFASLNPMHTVAYHLARPLLRHRRATASELSDRIAALLDTVALRPAADFVRRYPHQLSGGQRQRVAIARALAVAPALMLADEPTSMLDVSLRKDILDLLLAGRGAEQRAMACLFVTHDLGACRHVADRTLVMYAGRVVESAPTEALFEAPAHPYSQALMAAAATPIGGIRPIRTDGAAFPLRGVRGCPFAPHCPQVMDRCRHEDPAPRAIGPLREVRCHLYDSAPAAPGEVGGGGGGGDNDGS